MKRTATLQYGAINITMHPHSPKSYIELFNLIKKNSISINVRADKFCSMSSLEDPKDIMSSEPMLYGEFATYTHINTSQKWFNTLENISASEKDINKINVPHYLKPNCEKFKFIFFPDNHLLVFEHLNHEGKLSHSFLEKYFIGAFKNKKISNEFNNLSATIIKEPREVENLLAEKNIKKIKLITTRPNPDSLSSTEGKVKERFKKLNAIKEERILKAEKNKVLHLDEKLKMEARIAAKNGSVSVMLVGNDRKMVEKSTKDIPLVFHKTHTKMDMNSYVLLTSVAIKIRETLTSWLS